MTKISILDFKINMFLTLFILGLYYEVLNIHYPTKWKFRSDLKLKLFFKLRFTVSRGMKPTDHPFYEVFSIMFNKQSISLLQRSFKYKNKLYMAS